MIAKLQGERDDERFQAALDDPEIADPQYGDPDHVVVGPAPHPEAVPVPA